jgi:hypothetical protein
MRQNASEAVAFDSFDAALHETGLAHLADPVIFWNDLDAVAALDVDWHGSNPPANVELIAPRIAPSSRYWWRTHGGGLRLMYFANDRFSAEE